MTSLRFPDADGLTDLATYAGRAKSLDPEGAVRLHAHGDVLAAYVCVLPGSGLAGSGAVVGLRVMRLADPVELDTTVPLGAVTDRLARHPEGTVVLDVPPTTVTAPWTAVSPPRAGWERVGELEEEEVRAAARAGIAEIAEGAPEGAGGHAVTALRQQVWSQPTATVPPVPAGGAFAVHALGFAAPGARVSVYASGRWTRLSSPVGHVLVR